MPKLRQKRYPESAHDCLYAQRGQIYDADRFLSRESIEKWGPDEKGQQAEGRGSPLCKHSKELTGARKLAPIVQCDKPRLKGDASVTPVTNQRLW